MFADLFHLNQLHFWSSTVSKMFFFYYKLTRSLNIPFNCLLFLHQMSDCLCVHLLVSSN